MDDSNDNKFNTIIKNTELKVSKIKNSLTIISEELNNLKELINDVRN